MQLSKNNKVGYIQAAISILVIMCCFLPYIETSFGYYGRTEPSAMSCFTSYFVDDDAETHIGIFFVTFIMLQLINILVQARKNNSLTVLATNFVGAISIFLHYRNIDEFESDFNRNNYYYDERLNIDYTYGFYLVVVLMCIQTAIQLLSLLANQGSRNITEHATEKAPVYIPQKAEETEKQPETVQEVQPETNNELDALRAEAARLRKHQEMLKALEEEKRRKELLEKEKTEKELLEKEYRELKAKAEEMEKAKLEKERLEKERIEKENLKKEIANLKELLKDYEESSESN